MIRIPQSTKSSPGDVRKVASGHYRSGSFDLASNSHSSTYSHHSSFPLASRYGSTPLPQDSILVSNANGTSKGNSIDEERQSLLRHSSNDTTPVSPASEPNSSSRVLYYFIYALMNFMMAVPSLYGYASVIFNHKAYQPHIASLSKLCIWSSAVHQLVFTVVSSISFAKAEVQDAGLLFLSVMSNFIAETILSEGGEIEDILSTTIVTLSLATASLGMVLMFLGKFNCANAVSYLPLPVVGGYLAFIGYFCVVAGIGLCVSQSMIDGNFISDIKILTEMHCFMLALPGFLSGLLMMIVARKATHDAALPITMVVVPGLFYLFLYMTGQSLDDAREGQWVGEVQPTASVTSLIDLIAFDRVHWDLVFSSRCISTWLGMVFVVSFSSCLDIAAISMDMGEPLEVNKELITVGFSNLLSGLSCGFSGSYIFSTTILTYRTGYHSRWLGFMGVIMFLSVVISDINLLEIVPLYFLGSTLIFIGIDLLYEWLFEVWHKLIPSEYLVLMTTFVAIQIVGINGGIVVGIIIAVVEYVVNTATRVSSVRRRVRKSRHVWKPKHKRLLQQDGYDSRHPKIISLEISDTVFFGTSLLLLSKISEEIGISATDNDIEEMVYASPRHFSISPAMSGSTEYISSLKKKRQMSQFDHGLQSGGNLAREKHGRPKYVVLDLAQVPNVDATAARSCFLQLGRMCKTNGIILCASGANHRVDWVLRSHDAAYSNEEDPRVKREGASSGEIPTGKLILFDSMNDALHFCERKLIFETEQKLTIYKVPSDLIPHSSMESGHQMKTQLSTIFSRMLGMETESEKLMLTAFDKGGSASPEEIQLYYGDEIYTIDDAAESFYVILSGCVGIFRGTRSDEDSAKYLSSSGRKLVMENRDNFGDVVSYLQAGGIFGYVDFFLKRERSLCAVCSKDGTIVAKITRSHLKELQNKNEDLHRVLEKILLQVSLAELANFDVA
mmetsp:Transcript_27845/g.42687  ORF Transcript_27845/g.42687 Transcript_27845/m.42687 type:complete len:955 (-) Transcript_27845:205-3069(-)